MFALPLALSSLFAMQIVPATGGPESVWVGKVIMPKKAGLSIHRVENDAEAPIAELTELDYRVLSEKGERVQIKSRSGIVGWVRKNDVVLLADAPAHFTDRLQQTPDESDLYNRRAWAWKLKGDFDIAIKDFSEALRLNQDAAIYNNRAAAYLAKKDYDKAIVDYTEAIRLNPNFPLPYYNRAILWETKKEFDKAIDDYSDAIRLDPKYVAAYRNRGYMRHVKKDYDKAIDDFSEAIRLDPKDLNSYNDRANSWHEKKEYDKAISDFNEAVRLDPRFYFAIYNRGRAWEAKKEYDRAIEDYSETIRQNPKYVFGYWGRASAHNQTKRFDKAVADYNEALKLDPKNGRLLNSLAWLLATSADATLRDGKRALQLAREAHDTDRNNANLLDTLAAAYAETGEFEEAVRIQMQVLKDTSFANNPGARDRLELYRARRPFRQK